MKIFQICFKTAICLALPHGTGNLYAKSIRITFSGEFAETNAPGAYASLLGTGFSGEVRLPDILAPDLEPDDLDLGHYLLTPDQGRFTLDLDGTLFDLAGDTVFYVQVRDCNHNPGGCHQFRIPGKSRILRYRAFCPDQRA